MGDKVEPEVNGPTTVNVVLDPKTQQLVPQAGFWLCLSITNPKMIDSGPITSVLPLQGVFIPDQIIVQAVEMLLEQVRTAREKLNNPGPPPDDSAPFQPQAPVPPQERPKRPERPRESHFPSRPGSDQQLRTESEDDIISR